MDGIEAIKCYEDSTQNSEEIRTCEGDVCTISKGAFASIQRSCIAGIQKPSYNCTLDYDDTLVCYCSTDFCNTPNIFHTNVTVLPIIECKSVIQNIYNDKGCNKCIRIISYLKHDRYEMDKFPNQNVDLKDLEESVTCNTRADSGDFVVDSSIYMPERLLRNFFAKACYNVSMHREHYYIHCRCVDRYCNSPETPNLPYPISAPRTKCFTSGYDADVDNRKYEKPNVHHKENYKSMLMNDSFVDEGSECEGHFCFIAIYNMYLYNKPKEVYYYKGCISANEQGDQKLSLGYSYFNSVPYYICNTDYCNLDIDTALEAAKNGTLFPHDNQSHDSYFMFTFLFVPFVSSFLL